MLLSKQYMIHFIGRVVLFKPEWLCAQRKKERIIKEHETFCSQIFFCLFYFQSSSGVQPRKLIFQLKTSFDSGLVQWDKTRSCVLPNGDIIMYGKTADNNRTINVYRQGKCVKSLSPPCEHEINSLQPVLIQGSEYIAISCGSTGGCDEIYLLDPQTRKTTSAYKSPDLYPGKMCVGDPGTLYVVHNVTGERPVVNLDTRDKLFKYTGHRVSSGMETIYGLHYTTMPQKMLLFTWWDTNTIQAVDPVDGSLLWKVQWYNVTSVMQWNFNTMYHSLLTELPYQYLLTLFMCSTDHKRSYDVISHWKAQGHIFTHGNASDILIYHLYDLYM